MPDGPCLMLCTDVAVELVSHVLSERAVALRTNDEGRVVFDSLVHTSRSLRLVCDAFRTAFDTNHHGARALAKAVAVQRALALKYARVLSASVERVLALKGPRRGVSLRRGVEPELQRIQRHAEEASHLLAELRFATDGAITNMDVFHRAMLPATYSESLARRTPRSGMPVGTYALMQPLRAHPNDEWVSVTDVLKGMKNNYFHVCRHEFAAIQARLEQTTL